MLHLSEMIETVLRFALHGFTVYSDQAEAHPVAHLPLEVVHQAPIEITLYGNAVGNAAGHAVRCDVNEIQTAGIIVAGNAVLRHHEIAFKVLCYSSDHML